MFDIGNTYKIVDNDEFAEIKTVTLPTGTEPNMSADFSKDNNKVYYAQHGLAELQTGANEFVYTYDMNSGTLVHTLATEEGDIRRGRDSLLYIAGTDALQLATLKENLDGTITSGTAVGIDTVLSGGLPLQAHKVYNTTIDEAFYNRFVGFKKYELTDHLGNVRVVVSDVKTPKNVSDTTEGYNADIITYNTYYPGGMLMVGRNYNTNKYRFGFNGKEMDNDVKGLGNSYDFGARLLDPRLMRWKSLDPLQKKYPSLSGYQFVANNPIIAIDPDGKKIWVMNNNVDAENDFKTLIEVAFDGTVTSGINPDTKEMFFKKGKGFENLTFQQKKAFKLLNAMATSSEITKINLEQTADPDNKAVASFGDNFSKKTLYTQDNLDVTKENKKAGIAITTHFFLEQAAAQNPNVTSQDFINMVAKPLEENPGFTFEDGLYEYAHKQAIDVGLLNMNVGFEDLASKKDLSNSKLRFYNNDKKTLFQLDISINDKKKFTFKTTKQKN